MSVGQSGAEGGRGWAEVSVFVFVGPSHVGGEEDACALDNWWDGRTSFQHAVWSQREDKIGVEGKHISQGLYVKHEGQ